MKPSRRRFLTGAGVAAAAGGLVLWAKPFQAQLCGDDGWTDPAVARVGEACVRCDPALTREAVAARWEELRHLSAGELDAVVAREHAAGEVVSVDGWLLAGTEALRFAAAHHGVA